MGLPFVINNIGEDSLNKLKSPGNQHKWKRKALLFYQMRLKKLESKEAGTSLMKKYKKKYTARQAPVQRAFNSFLVPRTR